VIILGVNVIFALVRSEDELFVKILMLAWLNIDLLLRFEAYILGKRTYGVKADILLFLLAL
jgi:hypothetical protein